jgi:hypothetical protein
MKGIPNRQKPVVKAREDWQKNRLQKKAVLSFRKKLRQWKKKLT